MFNSIQHRYEDNVIFMNICPAVASKEFQNQSAKRSLGSWLPSELNRALKVHTCEPYDTSTLQLMNDTAGWRAVRYSC